MAEELANEKNEIENKEEQKIGQDDILIDDKNSFHIAGIGASAGGLEAIESFFVNMPIESNIAFVVIQHLSPDYKSLMVELLSKRTEMPVFRAESGIKVKPNCVYLIPPKKNLTIFHGKLILNDPDTRKGINLPIDIFFRSLAEDQGEKAVGIVLSGTGSDGMRGVRAIKESGGMVMVQDEESAKFDGMPRSAISTGLADFILPPDEMPKELLSYVKHPYVTKATRSDTLLTDEDNLIRIFSLLREKNKLDFTYYKMSTIIRRIERRMTVNQIKELAEYVRFLEDNPREVYTLYREMLIGVTNFFRDREAFAELENNILPEIFVRKKSGEVRLWITACSSGEEAYSIAILCQETMERIGKKFEVKIFATDVDNDAILRAGNGIYPESIAADINPKYLSKYFFKKDDNFQITRKLREMVVFAQHNLIKDPPFTNIDFVSCRNLLIYLQPVLQRKALEFFNFSLNPKGILFLGTSETVGDLIDFYEPLHHKWKIYRTKGKIVNKFGPLEPITPKSQRLLTTQRGFESVQRVYQTHKTERIIDRFLQALEQDYVPLALVVNEQLELQHVLGNTSGIFKIPSGKVFNDITKLANKDLAIPMATGIQKAFKTMKEIIYSNLRVEINDKPKMFTMRIKMLPEKKGQEPLAVVYLEDSKVKQDKPIESDTLSYDIGKEAEQRLIDLEQELQFNKENLQATIEELETSNEELQATNEELLASNEELQSTNEELQSVNEELHTVNAEYQAKIVELTELNNDIDNLMSSTQIATLFLDENLEIRKFTSQIEKIVKLMEIDVGRYFGDLSHKLKDCNLIALVDSVQQKSINIESEVQNIDGDWFLMRLLPYHIGPRTYSGVVLIFIEISNIKSISNMLNASEEKYQDLVDHMNTGVWYIDKDAYTTYVNPAMAKMLGYTLEEMLGRHLFEFADEEGIRTIKNNLKRREEGIVEEHQFTLLTKEGNTVYTVMDTSPIYDSQGKYDGSVASVRDITKEVEMNSVIQENEAHISSIIKASPIGIGMVKNRVIVTANKRLTEITGYSDTELIGNSSRILYPDDSEYEFVGREKYRQILESGIGTVEARWKHKDGRILNILLSSAPLVPGKNEEGVTFTALDITSEKNNIMKLHQSEERLDMAMEASGFAWWDWDYSNNTIKASPLKYKFVGYKEKDFDGTLKKWLSLIHPEDYDKAMSAMQTHLEGKSDIYEVHYRLKHKSGKWVWLEDKGKVILRDENNKPLRIMGTVRKLSKNEVKQK